jgi:L-rhamnose mutarotase
MQRQAYTMQLNPGSVAEYKKRHDEIWPELASALRAAGVTDFSIFLDEEALTLFVCRKISDPEAFAKLPQLPVVRKWWDFMAPLMAVNPDNSPQEHPLREVFRLD